MSNERNEIATIPQRPLAAPRPLGIQPSSYDDLKMLATAAAKSGVSGAKTPEAAFMIAVRAMEMGVSPATALTTWHWVNNKPCPPSDTFIGLPRSRPDLCKYFRLVEVTDDHATWETWRVGEPEPTKGSFTIAQAKAAGYYDKNPNWKSIPQQMLKKRAGAFLARDVYPDLFGGIHSVEEMRDVVAMQGGHAEPEYEEPAPKPARVEVTQPATVDPIAAEVQRVLKGLSCIGPDNAVSHAEQTALLADLRKSFSKLSRILKDGDPRRDQLSVAGKDAEARLLDVAEREAVKAQDAAE